VSWLFRWASEQRVHGLPTPAELAAEGYQIIAQHPTYTSSWLMWRCA
jgi:hypothetical protein